MMFDRNFFRRSVKETSIIKYDDDDDHDDDDDDHDDDDDDDDDRSPFHRSVKETSIISEMMMMVMIEIPFTGL